MRSQGSAVVVVAAMLGMTACSSGNSHSGASVMTPAATMVNGSVVDAFVSGAMVSAYQITSAGAAGALITGPVTTAANGNYTLNLGTYTGPVLLESTGGVYVDPVSGQQVNLANTGLTLMAVIPSASGSVTAQVTPLTTMAAQLALALISGGSSVSTAVTTANSQVNSYFGLSNLLTTALVDLTQAGCSTNTAQASIDESLLLAGIAQLAMAYGVTPYNLEIALIQDFTSNGTFSGMVNGTPIIVPLIAGGTIALSSIESGAATQVATGALPGLEAAIQAFQGSAANVCAATASSSQEQDLDAPSTPPLGFEIPFQVVVSGLSSGQSALIRIILPLTAGSSLPSVTAGFHAEEGAGTYDLDPQVQYTASSFTGAWSLDNSSVVSPAGETCGVGTSASGPFTDPVVSGNFTGSNANTTLFVDCSTNLYTVSGTISDYTGSGLVMADTVSGQSQTIASGGTSYSFNNYTFGDSYNIEVQTQPTGGTAGEECSVQGTASGTISGNVGLNVTCSSSSGITPVAVSSPQGLWFFSPYVILANAGSSNTGQVLIYSETLNSSNDVTAMTLVASITQGIADPTRLFVDSNKHLFVTNIANNTVTVYDLSVAANITGNSIPQITAATISSGLSHPLGVAVDFTNNDVYVANNSGNSISVYAPGASGYTQVGSALTEDGAGNPFSAPGALASYSVGGDDYLLVGLGASSGVDSVFLYPEPLTSSTLPLYNLNNSSCTSGPSGPTGIALQSNGIPSVWISSFYSSKVSAWEWPFNDDNNCPPPAFSSSSTSGIAQPEGVTVDGFGNVFVSNSSANTVTVYGPGEITDAPEYTQH